MFREACLKYGDGRWRLSDGRGSGERWWQGGEQVVGSHIAEACENGGLEGWVVFVHGGEPRADLFPAGVRGKRAGDRKSVV